MPLEARATSTASDDDFARGLLLCGHGSRSASAVAEFGNLFTALNAAFLDVPFNYKACDYGFLEFARPTLGEALSRLCARGIKKIDALPGMLLAAGHAKNDIPALLRNYELEHGVEIRYARPLGLDARMLCAATRRVQDAVGDDKPQSYYHDTLLVVVGRGSSDPDANSDVAKLTRLLWESLGFGWAITAYSGVTFPLVAPTLELATRLDFRRVVVFPYFLFSGILIERIYAAVDAATKRWREVEFIKAHYLDCQADVVDTFMARAREIESGDGAMMNCALCKYRELVVGFEAEHGAAQASHHHHVEGIGMGEASSNHHHHHHHAQYPHASHPMGVRTLKKG